jgi:ribosomal protein L24
MASLKIKKGDKVVILSGKDKGKHGEVTKAFPKDGKVIVGGVNLITRHVRQTLRVASSRVKPRSTSRRLRLKIQKRASQRGSVLKCKATRRSVWPSSRDRCSNGR